MSIVLDGTTGINTSAGVEHAGAYTGTYSDGTVVDYVTGLGRISVGGGDGLAFYNGGVATTELMRLNSSGQLGIGTANPVQQLQVSNGSGYTSIRIDGANTGGGAYTHFHTLSGTQNGSVGCESAGSMYVGTRVNQNLQFLVNNNVVAQFNTSQNLQFSGSNTGIVFNNSSALTNSTLNDYETGNWTPTDGSGAGLTLNVNSATYTKIGRLVTVTCYVTYPSTANGNVAFINGLPFAESTAGSIYCTGALSTNSAVIGNVRINTGTPSAVSLYIISNNTAITNNQISSAYVIFSMTYLAAF